MKTNRIKVSIFTALGLTVALSSSAQPVQIVQDEPTPNQSPSPPNPSSPPSAYEKRVQECPCLFSARHVLAGHAFLPVLEQPSAFADSKFTLGIGVAQGTYGVIVNGANTDVNLISFAPTLNVQVAITSRLAVFAGFVSSITSGLNSQSALIYGGSVRYAWNFGALYELLRTHNSVLSLAFQVNRPHTLAVSPLQSAANAEGAVLSTADPNVVNTTVTTEYRPNLRFAHGFNSSIGIQASLGVDFRSTLQNGNSQGGTLLTGALGLSSDLNPWLSVPIGFTLDYSRNQIISRSEDNANIGTIGIWETFTHRFNAGAELGWVRRGGLDSTIGAVIVRTYYN